MAQQEAQSSFMNVSSTVDTAGAQEPRPRRYVRLPSFWKAMIITSFVFNMIFVFILILLVGFYIRWQSQISDTTVGLKGFAVGNIQELRDVVQQLQAAHIRTTIPVKLDVPVNLIVPINQTTVVTTTEPVPISVPADIDMGPFGQLHPNVNLSLPPGTQLRIALKLDVPLSTTIPLDKPLPIDIALDQTDLAPQFKRLGNVVDRLVYPVAPLLGIDGVEKPEPPQVPK